MSTIGAIYFGAGCVAALFALLGRNSVTIAAVSLLPGTGCLLLASILRNTRRRGKWPILVCLIGASLSALIPLVPLGLVVWWFNPFTLVRLRFPAITVAAALLLVVVAYHAYLIYHLAKARRDDPMLEDECRGFSVIPLAPRRLPAPIVAEIRRSR